MRARNLALALVLTAAILVNVSPASADPVPPSRICNFHIDDGPITASYTGIKWSHGWVVYAWQGDSHLSFGYGLCQTEKSSLRFQNDGNLVLYDELNRPRWDTGTWLDNWWGGDVIYQSDGNFVVYGWAFGNFQALWASNTDGCYSCALAVQADGNVVIYDTHWSGDTWSWTPIWATYTWH